MEEHLGWHIPNFLSFEFSIPDKPWPSSEINCHLTKTVVHRQSESISFNSPLVSKSLCQTFTKCDSSIFNCVMFIHIEIAFHSYKKISVTMLCNLFKNEVEKTDTSVNILLSRSIKTELNLYISFFCAFLVPPSCHPEQAKRVEGSFFPRG